MESYLDEPYETSEEMDELREIKKHLSLERYARTPEEQQKHSDELREQLRKELTTATFA